MYGKVNWKKKKKDGSDFWVYSIISPQFDDYKNIKGYTTIDQDISDKKMIELLSLTDKLTGIYNRGQLDELLKAELARSSMYNSPFSIIMIDIDFSDYP